ncbi:hypothetical protein [Pectobacterium carotovorum]|uniref:hypothetical protein n=1 Tax=Pectobacterium carotovorum TaxID=554 RepID=UPI000505B16D|nr:hypothetical protein [Pectobacterium carotovorum]KFW97591.1 hypothetical protein JV33_21560 [Pectobacterium carotovorum subsp. carotovorum]KML64938.1 hypothetical protein G032_20965 [Pectobacterium carotovorum subsp. carotovorum ICMP 5702]SHH68031.1 hypothetical protein SAMN05444147_1165 [Pectobacterium carotovorum]
MATMHVTYVKVISAETVIDVTRAVKGSIYNSATNTFQTTIGEAVANENFDTTNGSMVVVVVVSGTGESVFMHKNKPCVVVYNDSKNMNSYGPDKYKTVVASQKKLAEIEYLKSCGF